ncbi:SdrD B-like domain-containing protein [Sphaerotilus sulfidivorans]
MNGSCVLTALSSFTRRALAVLALALPVAALAADPQIASVVDNPDPVPAGGQVTYTVTVDNNAADAALNTRLQFSMPSGAAFVSAGPLSQNCAPQSATLVECNLGSVAGSGADTRTLTFVWRATVAGPATLNPTLTLLADNDVNPGNNVETATTTVIAGANLALAKIATPEPVVGGANVTYTLTASNPGPNDSAGIVITDTLSPSSTYVSASGSGWSCSHSAGVVTCSRSGPHVAGAAIPSVTLVATVNASGGTITNTATVAPASGGTADPDNSNNTAIANSTVLPGADVRIAQKIVTSTVPAIAGQNATFQIQPRNSGPSAGSNVVVTDTLPAGWTYVSGTGTNWSCSAAGQVVSCTRAAMPVGATDNINIVATAPSSVAPTGTTFTNNSSISAASTDPVAGNNNAAVNILVLPDGADLRLAKTKTPNPVAQGSSLTTTLTVTNNGPRVATGPLKVVDVLSGETFVSSSPAAWSCSATGSVVECTHANGSGLAVGASLPALVLTTTATGSGTLTNQACTGSSLPPGSGAATASPPLEGDANNSNDCTSAGAVSTTVQPDLAITKTTTTPSGGDKVVSSSEASVTYTLVVTNASATPQNATGVRITDTVPAFIRGRTTINAVTATVSGGSTATFSCSIATATVTCTQTGGVLAQGETVTVPITVNRAMSDGSFTNTATVTNTAEGDPTPGNNSASDTVTIEPIADVEVTGKTVSPASVRAGETATYVISYRNNGPSTAASVLVSDTFTFGVGDTGLTVVSIASNKPGSTCTVGAGSVLNPGAPAYSCTIGSLTNGETRTITLVVRPNFMAGDPARTFNNTAAITTTTVENPAGGDNGNNSRSAVLNITASSIDLLVNTTDVTDPVPYTAGNTFLNYRVRVTSNGPSYGTNVHVTNTMAPPAGKRVRFVCDTTTLGGSTCNPVALCSVSNVTSGVGTPIPAVTCSVPAGNATTGLAVGDLASGQSKDIFLRFEVLDQPAVNGDVFNNTAVVSANEADSFNANDTEAETTTVRQRVDLRVTKAASASPVSLNQPFNWTITVVNNGPGNSAQTDLTDTLPAGVQVTGAINFSKTLPAGSGSCSLAGQAVTCALGALDATGTATITVPVRFTSYPTGGTATNTATVDTDPAKTGGINTPGGNNTGTSVVSVTKSSISGLVFEDRLRDGANAGTPQSAALEPRVAGVTITLTGTDAYGNPISRSTTTASDGTYLFDNLPPSDGTGYTITQTQPVGLQNCPETPPMGSVGGSYNCGGTFGDSVYSLVVLPANTPGINYNFPEIRRVSLSGFVYIDSNANGVRNAGVDAPIQGATVRLLDANTLAVLATTTTAADGSYSFTNLDPLVWYAVEEVQPTTPAGLVQGPVNLGLVNGVSCAGTCLPYRDQPSPGSDLIRYIDLTTGVDGTQFNFGELQVATISGTVYIDRNRNGTMDATPTDARANNVTLRLVQGADCSSGTTLQTTTTAADGSYSFANVTAGPAYLVCETLPAGHGHGSTNPGSGNSTPGAGVISIPALSPSGSTANNFGLLLASLAGSVYADVSPALPANTNNGVRDAGEAGIANVPVTLTGVDALGNPVNLSTTTDATGNYRFDDLLASNGAGYTVTEGAIPPAAGNFNDGLEHVGSSGGNAAVNDTVSGIVLAAGVQATAYDFGELPQASIGGTVYVDRNRNNLPDASPTDAPLAGVTLRLVQGADCGSGTVLQTVTTDATGAWLFTAVSAGNNYLVCETQPVGVLNGVENPGSGNTSPGANVIAITNLPAGGSSGNHFGERLGSVAGSVFLDTDNNGARNGADTGIAGVTLTLTGTDVSGNPVNRSTTTDASGNYRFDDLLAAGAGGYTLTEQAAQPVVGGTATLNGRTTAGTVAAATVGTATAVASTPSAVSAITLAAGADSVANDFAEVLPVRLSGAVFIDAANNGTRELPGDLGLAGVTVQITGTDDLGNPVSRTLTTAADGSFVASDLRPGTYTLTEPTQPPGTSNGITTPGSAGGNATNPATVPSQVSNIVLTTPGASSLNNLFGEVASSGVISGTVWLDQDASGTRNGTEAGIAGVTLTLTGTDLGGNPVNRSTTTDASGNYSFTGLSPGSYVVTEPTQPTGTVNGVTLAGSRGGSATAPATLPSAINAITLGVGESGTGYDFLEVPAGQIGGRVFLDAEDNGVQDAGDAGIPGVTVTLTGADDLGQPVSQTTTTAPDGSYSFANLRPGTYAVSEPTQPPGTVNGQTVAGNLGGNATPVATVPSQIGGIVLPVGGSGTAYNFAEIGHSPDLRVSKRSGSERFTVGHLGSYVLSVRNAGEVPSSGEVVVSDRLPAGITLAATPSGTDWLCTGAAGDSSFTCRSSSVLAAGATHPGEITARVQVAVAAQAASPAINAVMVEGGGEPPLRAPTPAERSAFAGTPGNLPACAATPSHNACRLATPVQLAAAVSGTAWMDTGSRSRVLDAADRRLPNWQVEVLDVATGLPMGSAVTAADGSYRIGNLLPGVELAIRFRDPVSNVVFGYPVNGEAAPGSSGAGCDSATARSNGSASSCVETGVAPQLTVVLAPGQELPQQSLPVDPSGVVYDAVIRQPVPGAVVTLSPVGVCAGYDPATQIVGAGLGGYTLNGQAIAMTTGADGFYQFLFGTNAPASCTFALSVAPPSGYRFVSTLIAPTAGPLVPPGGPGSTFLVQPQAAAPSGAVGSATTYYLSVVSGSGGANIIHNHLPLDPAVPTALTLSKSGDKAVAETGDTVRYTLTVQLTAGARPAMVSVLDRLPAGFTYVPGTAMLGSARLADPAGAPGPQLAFNLGAMPASGQLVLHYRARVNVGSAQGDGINRARAHACGAPAGCYAASGSGGGAAFTPVPGSVPTNEAVHRVRVQGGVFGTAACFAGKVFVDCNHNHVQDAEELGIPGVRLVLQDGTTLISDVEGKYSMCGLPPKSHMLKVDSLTLPRGSRLTTSSNRNLGDAGSLWLDLKNGELHRADFVEGSCSNTVLEQVKARRAQGEVRAPETEKKGGPALRFDSKAHQLNTLSSPQQGTDGANQLAPKAREGTGPARQSSLQQNTPTISMPMNRPPPTGRSSADAPDSAASAGGSDASR